MPSRFIFSLSGSDGKRGLRRVECGKYGVWNMRSVENEEYGQCINFDRFINFKAF